MTSRLDWTKAEPGLGGYDEALGDEWRVGPRGEDRSFPDIDAVYLGDKPPLDIGRKLTAVFGGENDAAHDRMASHAKRTADRVRGSLGLDGLKTRSRQFNERASSANPWPTLWFAFYFDYFAGRLYRAARPQCERKGSRDLYFTGSGIEDRWHARLFKVFGFDVLSEIRKRQNGRSVARGRPRPILPGGVAPRGVPDPAMHDAYASAHDRLKRAVWRRAVSPSHKADQEAETAAAALKALREAIEAGTEPPQGRKSPPKTLDLRSPR